CTPHDVATTAIHTLSLHDALPIYTNSSSAIRSINPELEDAVRILGGSRFTAIWRVVMPLLKRSLAGAFILVFIPATRELSAAIFLYSRSEEHTSEVQSRENLVCRLLLE